MNPPKHPKFQLKKSHPLFLLFALLSLVAIIPIALSATSIQTTIKEKNHQKRIAEATSFCANLFDETITIIKDDTTIENLEECKSRLSEVPNSEEETAELRQKADSAIAYLNWINKANEYIDNNIVKATITPEDLSSLDQEAKALPSPYLQKATEKYNYLKSEYGTITNAKSLVNNLFTSEDRAEVRTTSTREEYNSAREATDALKQPELKQTLSDALDQVLPVIEEQERIARERAEAARRAREEEQRKIAESWHTLDISPYYINQYYANILNGCEAASLLMALNYKGYLRGTSFESFAANMPTADDPNQGFYLTMYELEPRTEAHWIAPAPLAAYGRSASGATIVNATGWSLDQLDAEVASGHPVVIYLTYAFNNPKQYSKGVPKNLHVMVLSGYNSYTGVQQFYDPWPVGPANSSLSKSRTEYLYAASGHRALVIK